MPALAMVKLVNTPMAYSGMSRSTLAPVATSSTIGDHGQRDDRRWRTPAGGPAWSAGGA